MAHTGAGVAKAQLAKNLKTARTAKGISQVAAAKAVGKSRQTIINWESPEATPTPDEEDLMVLARLYEVTTQDLRYGELAGRAAPEVRQQQTLYVRERRVNPYGVAEPELPRRLELMALDFEREAIEAGADPEFMRYARLHLRDPYLMALFAGGYTDRPLSIEEQEAEYTVVIEELRRLLSRRIERLGAHRR